MAPVVFADAAGRVDADALLVLLALVSPMLLVVDVSVSSEVILPATDGGWRATPRGVLEGEDLARS